MSFCLRSDTERGKEGIDLRYDRAVIYKTYSSAWLQDNESWIGKRTEGHRSKLQVSCIKTCFSRPGHMGV